MPRSTKSHILTQGQAKQTQVKTKPIPRPAPLTPQAQTRSNSFGSGFVDSMVSGFGLGIGSSLARKIFEPKITPEHRDPVADLTVQHPSVPDIQPSFLTSNDIFNKYQECLQSNESNTNCEMLLNMKS
jgi:hypothetical protein